MFTLKSHELLGILSDNGRVKLSHRSLKGLLSLLQLYQSPLPRCVMTVINLSRSEEGNRQDIPSRSSIAKFKMSPLNPLSSPQESREPYSLQSNWIHLSNSCGDLDIIYQCTHDWNAAYSSHRHCRCSRTSAFVVYIGFSCSLFYNELFSVLTSVFCKKELLDQIWR